jgi:DNA-binding NtrC family response regulator
MSSQDRVPLHAFSVPPISDIPTMIVEPDDADRLFLSATLTSAGLHVTATESFSSARQLLVAQPPSILVTEIRLGAYNGLHLAHLGRWLQPHMRLIVMSRFHDRVLRRDAEVMGAAFVQKPVTSAALLAALYSTMLREPNADGTLEPIRSRHDCRLEEHRRMAAAFIDEEERRSRKRRRKIATFLFFEALRR